jgi:hypothetical protein
MALKDLSSFLDDDAIDVPIDGKTYRVESPDAKTGLFLASLANVGVKAAAGGEVDQADVDKLDLDDDEERDFMQMVLGDTLAELVADGVSWTKIQRLSRYCFIHFAVGEEAADDALKSGALSGEAPAPNRAKRRAASRGGATTTKRLASTAGTTSTKTPARKPRAKA